MIYKAMATDLLSVTLILAREWPRQSACNSLKRMLLRIPKVPGEAPEGTMETRRANSHAGISGCTHNSLLTFVRPVVYTMPDGEAGVVCTGRIGGFRALAASGGKSEADAIGMGAEAL